MQNYLLRHSTHILVGDETGLLLFENSWIGIICIGAIYFLVNSLLHVSHKTLWNWIERASKIILTKKIIPTRKWLSSLQWLVSLSWWTSGVSLSSRKNSIGSLQDLASVDWLRNLQEQTEAVGLWCAAQPGESRKKQECSLQANSYRSLCWLPIGAMEILLSITVWQANMLFVSFLQEHSTMGPNNGRSIALNLWIAGLLQTQPE